MQKHRGITIDRFHKFTQKGQFDDVNLRTLLWKHQDASAVKMSFYAVPHLNRISFQDAIQGKYVPFTGQKLGPSWATFWFKLDLDIPAAWAGEKVLLIFDPNCEAMVWSTTGTPIQGITGGNGGDRHVDVLLTQSAATQGEHKEIYIEVACNGMFGNGDGMINPPLKDKYFSLDTAQLAVPNKDVEKLFIDFEIISGIAKELSAETQISADALYTANAIVNAVHMDRPATVAEGLALAADFFARRSTYGFADHEILATGHCHIDTAWLWPYDETKRKAARSWATQCGFMDLYPDYTFSCSQAQQYEWIEDNYPKLFKKITEKVESGNFIPIGGTWVEMDCNVPSGEAFCRQFLYGQRYFQEKFNKRSTVFWLPDTFGYSAQLPQIMIQSGLKYFFTQKLSWNNINKFPHTTFNWVGLDGSSVLTHFSPADTYNAQCSVRDINFSVKNNKDKEYSDRSLLLYGNGDGGGGPLIPMIERLNRMKSVSGLPATVKFGDPHVFYEELEKRSRDLISWKGELYFELHRGTYTTHCKIKRYNRKCEYLLRELELVSSLCVLRGLKYSYPKDEIDRLWKMVLLNQFHDVLPGSSIELVYDDARKFYEDVEQSATKMLGEALNILSDSLKSSIAACDVKQQGLLMINSTSWEYPASVVEVEAHAGVKYLQTSMNGKKGVILVDPLPSMSLQHVDIEKAVQAAHAVITVVKTEKSEFRIENKHIIALFDECGRLCSFVDKRAKRELVPKGTKGNLFRYFEDIPMFWDAWDVEIYHLEKGWDAKMGTVTIEESGPLRVVLKCQHRISPTSHLEQRIIVNCESPAIEFDTHVKWNENRKILKVEFPVNINCDYATYETQFGFVQRPTHSNTSWDMAKFEVCGHKFVDFSEYGYGVTMLNDCKYGHAVHGNIMRMSLIRAPKAPDLNCDIGDHVFKYAFYPHLGSFLESDVVQTGYQFNVLPTSIPSTISSKSLLQQKIFSVDQKNVVLDTFKLAEPSLLPGAKVDGKTFIIRVYEAYGGRSEETSEAVSIDSNGDLCFEITPFQVIGIKAIIEV